MPGGHPHIFFHVLADDIVLFNTEVYLYYILAYETLVTSGLEGWAGGEGGARQNARCYYVVPVAVVFSALG